MRSEACFSTDSMKRRLVSPSLKLQSLPGIDVVIEKGARNGEAKNTLERHYIDFGSEAVGRLAHLSEPFFLSRRS